VNGVSRSASVGGLRRATGHLEDLTDGRRPHHRTRYL
jgi:hypothetical protein